ncbi:dCTP deaminase [Providencia rettgeri]|uniref:dCTP deaminase n=1 Tax=Providencia rettgeri TaxID=587 RepID=UPI00235F5901|nr:hypothetical protein [Providencia rettgeri]
MVLSDCEIRKKIDSIDLITNYDDKKLRGASYELRMGNVYYDLTESSNRIELKKDEKVIIKPGHYVVLITKESVNIPKDLIAKITSKGSLFSIGLSPVATCADPGFSGQLGIITQNISNKFIELPQDEGIAKIDFSILSGKVSHDYKGQHGYQTNIWPIKYHLQKSYDDVKNDRRVKTEDEEAYVVLPYSTSRIIKKIISKQRITFILLLCIVFITTLLNTYFLTGFNSTFLINIVVNIVCGIVVWLITKYMEPKV